MKMRQGDPVDNRSLDTKLHLRSWLLGRMGIDSLRVLDTCAGAGHIWSGMAARLPVTDWVRCDLKPRQAGTLKLDATDAIKALDLTRFNVIDIDPYGLPWEPYLALLERIERGEVTLPLAVFLTRGRMALMRASIATMKAVGLPHSWGKDLPRSSFVTDFLGELILSRTWNVAHIDHAARVMMPRNNVAYYALGLSPKKETP